jgi:hypothetical protein
MIGLLRVEPRQGRRDDRLPSATLLEESIEADARQFRKARKSDLLSAVRNGVDEARFLELYGNFAGIPEYLSFGSGRFSPSNALGPALWSHGLPNPFASADRIRGFALLTVEDAMEVCARLTAPSTGSDAVRPLAGEYDARMISDFCTMANHSRKSGHHILVTWFRNPDSRTVWLQGHLVDMAKLRQMLSSRDPEYLVTLRKEARRQTLMYSLEHPEQDRHTCEVRRTVLLAPTTSKLVFDEGFDEEAFRLLLGASGLDFNPGARPNENHTIRELTPAQTSALAAVSDRAAQGALDLGAVAERAGLDQEEMLSLNEPEGRLRYLITEEVGPEAGQFLMKKGGRGATLFLFACV